VDVVVVCLFQKIKSVHVDVVDIHVLVSSTNN
jgi:hypothetical protein